MTTKEARAAYMREYRKTHKEKRTAAGIKKRYDWMSERRRERKAQDPEYATQANIRARAGRTAEAHRAQESVRRAIRSGKLVRPEKCEVCGSGGVIEASHRDYTKRLDVNWLCRSCHRREDRNPKGGYQRQAVVRRGK